MENPSTPLSSMNTEFLIDAIMSRLDGPSIAASACASSNFRVAASDQNLWKNLCAATWPSIESVAAQLLVSSASIGKGFDKFYADAFPLILCQPQENTPNPTVAHTSSSDLATLVDIYYNGKCILSKLIDSIPNPVDIYNSAITNKADGDHVSNELLQWLLDYPFRLDLLPNSDESDILAMNDDDVDCAKLIHGKGNECVTYLPLSISTSKNGKTEFDLPEKLAEDIRMSWILFDKKNGKCVNLSSWKPTLVKKSWVPDGEYVLHFGSIIPVSDMNLLPDKFAECKIVARCQLIQNSGCVKWTEISMRVKNMAGAHLNTTKTLAVLNKALYSKRTTNHLSVEKANSKYKMNKKKLRRRHAHHDYLVDKFYTLVGLTVLMSLTCCYAMLFQ